MGQSNSIDLYSCSSLIITQLVLGMQSSTINLKHYVSVTSWLIFKASQFVKECAENPNLKKFDKGFDDPVTEADFKIQTFLIRGIRHFFPALKIVGEQTKDYEGHIELNVEQITFDGFPENSDLEENVPIQELCLWIDPIDNTSGFVKGNLEAVTILVGMTRNQIPYLGFIGTPYQQINEKLSFKPRLFLGFAPKKNAFCSEEWKAWSVLQRPAKRKVTKLVSSSRKTNSLIDEIASKLGTQLQKSGGSGCKINMVIKGQADALVYLGSGNCRWDSCSGQAIIAALGGIFTDQHGKPIIYRQGANYVNDTGNICTLDVDLHKSLVETIALLQNS